MPDPKLLADLVELRNDLSNKAAGIECTRGDDDPGAKAFRYCVFQLYSVIKLNGVIPMPDCTCRLEPCRCEEIYKEWVDAGGDKDAFYSVGNPSGRNSDLTRWDLSMIIVSESAKEARRKEREACAEIAANVSLSRSDAPQDWEDGVNDASIAIEDQIRERFGVAEVKERGKKCTS